MKTRPILFNAEMVRAAQDGRKTQTRRVIRPPFEIHANGYLTRATKEGRFSPYRCPYGRVGDHLVVRETWAAEAKYDHLSPSQLPVGIQVWYRADDSVRWPAMPSVGRGRWRPSIHMPTTALISRSRITLEVTDVRVERVQGISIKDIYAEGAITEEWERWREDAPGVDLPDGSHIENERDVFEYLWDSINAKRGYSWEENPWVWVVSFKVIP